MPTYTFKNKETGRTFDKTMKMDEREPYLKKHPNLIQVVTLVHVGDSVRVGVSKPPEDFQKYVLGKVKAKNPLGNVERQFGTINKEI